MSQPSRTCPACGAALRNGSVMCEYCGSRAVPVALSFQQRTEIGRLAGQFNTLLAAEAKALRGQAAVIALLAWMPGAATVLYFWLVQPALAHGWMYAALYGLLCLGLRVVLLRTWGTRRFIDMYRREVEPQIAAFARQVGLPRWQFDQVAAAVLEARAPLRQFLKVRPEPKPEK